MTPPNAAIPIRSIPWRRIAALAGLALTASLVVACGKPFRAEKLVELAAPLPVNRVEVRNRMGEIDVSAESSANGVKAEALLVGHGATQKDADEALEQIEVELTPTSGGAVAAQGRHPSDNSWRDYEIRWRLTAPPAAFIKAHSDFGEVRAAGFREGVELSSNFGDVHAEAAGPIRLHTDFGNADVEVGPAKEGPVSVHSDFGNVTATLPAGRRGRLRASTEFGDLDVRATGVLLRELRRSGDELVLTLGEADEPAMDLTTDFGDVVVRFAGPAPTPEKTAVTAQPAAASGP